MSTKQKTKKTNNNNNNNNNTTTTNKNASELKEVFGGVVVEVEGKIKILEEKEAHWTEMEKMMQDHAEMASQKIVLDIGGQRFATSKTTLLGAEGSFFQAMIASGKWKPDSDGTYFVDRNPELFPVILDYLRMGKRFKDSTILDKAQKEKLLEWLSKKKTTLLYKATRDGFRAADFHRVCDKKGPTITIIRSTGGYLFGGYTSQLWDSSNGFKNGEAWIFTLTNPYNDARQFFPANNSRAIYCNSDYGPDFGSGDVYIADQSNSNSSSYVDFPSVFQDTVGNGNSTFTGSSNFQTNEIEIYLVQ